MLYSEYMKIIAIGGGEIGRPGFAIETEIIDREIIKLSGKKRPKLLFIPTASSDSEGYVEVVKKYFGKRLGCDVSVLYLIKNNPSRQEIEKMIFGTDIVYVGGGNTLKMMTLWRKLGVDKILEKASEKGVVMSGVSAGAVCWFRHANSDSLLFSNPSASLIKVTCLGLVPFLCCPHYDTEKGRKLNLKEMIKKVSGVAIALDNCAAIEIIDKQYKIVTSKSHAKAYRVYWRKDKFLHEQLPSNGNFWPLTELLDKSKSIGTTNKIYTS